MQGKISKSRLTKTTELMQFLDVKCMWYFLTHVQRQLSYLNIDGIHAPCPTEIYLILNSKRKKRSTYLSSTD